MIKYSLLNKSKKSNISNNSTICNNLSLKFEKYKKICEKLDRTYISLIIQIVHLILLMSIFIPSFIEIYNESNINRCSENISINKFLLFGPSNNLCFLGKNIDTWSKWILYMFLFAFAQGLSSASAEISSAWFSNQLANPEVELNKIISHINVQLYYLNWSLDNVLSIFTALTQIDFLLASILGSSIITILTTIYYFKDKKIYKDKLKDIQNNVNNVNNINNVDEDEYKYAEQLNDDSYDNDILSF